MRGAFADNPHLSETEVAKNLGKSSHWWRIATAANATVALLL
jgi:hypothetical protein